MKNPLDSFILLRYYLRLFGIGGISLYCHKAVGRLAPPAVYKLLTRLTWRQTKRMVPGTDLSKHLLSPESNAAWFEKQFPGVIEQKRQAAEAICNHDFDFLGTGRVNWGKRIKWHTDIKTGYCWPVRFFTAYRPAEITPGNGNDPKIPWELSRCHHFVALAQAWRLTKDNRFADECIAQWEHWLTANPWCYGINWTSTMEVAIRAVNWLYAFSLLSGAAAWNSEKKGRFLESIRQHAVFIENNLEVGAVNGKIIAANHYLANVCGLACVGILCPSLPASQHWRKAGLKAFEQEIVRQVLPDGFYFESSTSYHRFALEIFLVPALIARNCGHEMSEEYWKITEKMMDAVMSLTGPDGCVPQIGDNDDGRLLIAGRYPDWPRKDFRYLLSLGAVIFKREDFKEVSGGCTEDVYWQFGKEGVAAYEALLDKKLIWESGALPDAGLYVLRNIKNSDYALIRSGVPAESAPTAHAHNDALTLELWTNGKAVLVDPGNFCYTSNAGERNRFRSTAAHTTIMVDDCEINRLSPTNAFSIERTAKIHMLAWDTGTEKQVFAASHDGFERLVSPVTVLRRVSYDVAKRTWHIIDELSGAGNHKVAWFWHFAPGETAVVSKEEHYVVVRLERAETSMLIKSDNPINYAMVESYYAPGYGIMELAKCLEVTIHWNDKTVLTDAFIEERKLCCCSPGGIA